MPTSEGSCLACRSKTLVVHGGSGSCRTCDGVRAWVQLMPWERSKALGTASRRFCLQSQHSSLAKALTASPCIRSTRPPHPSTPVSNSHAFTQRNEPGLEVRVKRTSSENRALVVGAKRLTRWVHIVDPRHRATLDRFPLSPGHECRIPLAGRQRNTSHPPKGEVRALNATFSIQCQRDQKAMRIKARRVPSGRTSVSSGAAKQMRSLAHQVDGTVLNQF